MAFTLRVHEYAKIPGSPYQKIVKARHYIRFVRRESPPIYIQGGKLYSEAGDEIKGNQIPDWFHEAVQKTDPRQLHAVGYTQVPIEKKKKRGPKPKTVIETTESSEDSSDGDD